jgi:hypothetical protein
MVCDTTATPVVSTPTSATLRMADRLRMTAPSVGPWAAAPQVSEIPR